MNIAGVILLLLILSIPVLPVFAAESCNEETGAEWNVAHDILAGMMNERADVRCDPMAHELLGDVYRAAGMMEDARVEYQISDLLAEQHQPVVRWEVLTFTGERGRQGTVRAGTDRQRAAVESSRAKNNRE